MFFQNITLQVAEVNHDGDYRLNGPRVKNREGQTCSRCFAVAKPAISRRHSLLVKAAALCNWQFARNLLHEHFQAVNRIADLVPLAATRGFLQLVRCRSSLWSAEVCQSTLRRVRDPA